jgi:hypothetical protein
MFLIFKLMKINISSFSNGVSILISLMLWFLELNFLISIIRIFTGLLISQSSKGDSRFYQTKIFYRDDIRAFSQKALWVHITNFHLEFQIFQARLNLRIVPDSFPVPNDDILKILIILIRIFKLSESKYEDRW